MPVLISGFRSVRVRASVPWTGSYSFAKVTHQHYICRYLSVHLGGERCTVRVKCLAQEHNTVFD